MNKADITDRPFGNYLPIPMASYDATEDKKRRQAPRNLLRSEDRELKLGDRAKLITAARDLRRNFTIAGWAIRKHLDYTTTFTFQGRTEDPKVNQALEGLMAWWQLPENCDATRRFSLSQIIRMTDGCAVVDGDIFLIKLNDGRIQVVEGDRIRTPRGIDLPKGRTAKDFENGLRKNFRGVPMQWVFHKRRGNGFTFDRILNSRFVYHHFYIERFDQDRGISPLAPAINNFRDLYECNEYALAKMKVAQLFGLKITREVGGKMPGSNEDDTDDPREYAVDFSKGPLILDMDVGDDAEFLENKTPSQEFQSFNETTSGIALKCLDIPMSFYDESFTNYTGHRGALIGYLKSAAIKQKNIKRLLNNLTAWRVQMWMLEDQIELPNGMRFQDIKWEWIHSGIQWIDPLKEIKADVLAIDNLLATRTDVVAAKTGKDFNDLVKERKIEDDMLRANGLLPPLETGANETAAIMIAIFKEHGLLPQQTETPATIKT